MKTLYITLITMLAPLLGVGQTTYLVGTALSEVANLQAWSNDTPGFYKMRFQDPNETSYIIHVDGAYSGTSDEYNGDLWLGHHTKQERVFDMPLSQLAGLNTVDAQQIIDTYRGTHGLLNWGKSISGYGKTVYVIDRNEFYKSSPTLSQPDRMKVREVSVNWDHPHVHYNFVYEKYPPRKLFEVLHSKIAREGTVVQTIGYSDILYSHYVYPNSWPNHILRGQLPYRTVKQVLLESMPGKSIVMFNYANSHTADGCDAVAVCRDLGDYDGYGGYRGLIAMYKSSIKLEQFKLNDMSRKTLMGLALRTHNGYFVEVPCTNCTLLIFAEPAPNPEQNRIIIFAVTPDDARMVFDRVGQIGEFNIEKGKFRMELSGHVTLYEQGGDIWIFE